MTKPKYRPLGMATRPGSHAAASSSTTTAGSTGSSGSGTSSRSHSSSCVARGKTGRSSSESRKSAARSAVRCRRSRTSDIRRLYVAARAHHNLKCDDRRMRRTSAVLVVWSMFAATTIALIVTYSRLPPERLYNVTGSGFVHGGLSRALVYVNFPLGLAALAMLLVLADRMSFERRLAAVAAVVLWIPVFSSRVLSQEHLDATWRNAIPAAGVAIAA